MEYSGIVQEGSQKARSLGFPTINIALTDDTVSGIYAALVRIDRQEHPAAVYADQRRKILEAHLLNFSERLYGERVNIRLVEKIRDDKEFTGDEELKAAIEDDILRVKEYFRL